MGSFITKFAVKDPKVFAQVAHLVRQRSHVPVSEIVSLNLKAISKNGALCQSSSRVQLFYDSEGFARWNISCIDNFRVVSLHPDLQALSQSGHDCGMIHAVIANQSKERELMETNPTPLEAQSGHDIR